MSFKFQFLVVCFCLFLSLHASFIIDGTTCNTLRDIFTTKYNIEYPSVSSSTTQVDIAFIPNTNYSQYYILLNNITWLKSADIMFRTNGRYAAMQLDNTHFYSGYDIYGEYNELKLIYSDIKDDTQFATHFKIYPSIPELIVFSQSFPNGAQQTSIGNREGLSSAFPSFIISENTSSVNLGFVHFGGFMAGAEYPQYGQWTIDKSQSLFGGQQETGPLVLFDSELQNAMVISALSNHMIINDNVSTSAVFHNNGSNSYIKQIAWGLHGDITEIPVGFSLDIILCVTNGGINRAMQEWGDRELQYFNMKKFGNSHERDFTLQYLGYSTDHGAYYYYNTEPSKNYQQTIIDIEQYMNDSKIPVRYILLDSWWYYQGINGGVKNWTAKYNIFPNGLSFIHQQTKWYVQAHNRYWSLDNVYADNIPSQSNDGQFPFTFNSVEALPMTQEFWEYLFDKNEDWGLIVYEQDWLSSSQENIQLLWNSTLFAHEWLLQMNDAALAHNLCIQYCMSYPRHILSSVELKSVTQARASDDYNPGINEQWKIGVSSILTSAIDIAPSKDSFWSMNYNQSNGKNEPYNRLQSAVLSMSNGPIAFSDRIGFSDRELIMRCCNEDGLLLRPSMSAVAIDRFFLSVSGFMDNGYLGEIWTSTSMIGSSIYHQYFTVFAAELENDFVFEIEDLVTLREQNNAHVDGSMNFLVYEANKTGNFQIFNGSHPLVLNKCGKYDFQMYSLVPIMSGFGGNGNGGNWYLQGEIDKWITVSAQRFVDIDSKEGGVSVRVMGAVNEVVNIGFVFYNETSIEQRIISCTIGESKGAVVRMPAGSYFPF